MAWPLGFGAVIGRLMLERYEDLVALLPSHFRDLLSVAVLAALLCAAASFCFRLCVEQPCLGMSEAPTHLACKAECTKIAHRRSLAIFLPQTRASQGIPQRGSVLPVFIAEEIAVR